MRGFFVMFVFSFALILALPPLTFALSPKSKFIQKKAPPVYKKVEPIKNVAPYLDTELGKIHRLLSQRRPPKNTDQIKTRLLSVSPIFWSGAQEELVQKRAMALLSGWTRLAQCFINEGKIDEAHQALKKGGRIFLVFFKADEVQQQFPYLIKGYSFLVAKVSSKKDFDLLLKIAQEVAVLSRHYSVKNSPPDDMTNLLEKKLVEMITWFNKTTRDEIKKNHFLVAKPLFCFTNEIMERFRYFPEVVFETEFVAKNCQRLWLNKTSRSETLLASSL